MSGKKKLYKEVKDGDKAFKLYKRKSVQLLNKEAKEGDQKKLDNIRAETKQLYIYSTLLVSLQSTKTISERIKKIRDEELHLQLVELLNCLRKTWKTMFESHEIQGQIMHEVGSLSCSIHEKLSNGSHLLASLLQLEGALRKWYANFVEYVSTQKAYVRAVDGWLRQFFPFEVSIFSKGMSSIKPPPVGGGLRNFVKRGHLLPYKAVARALESFCEDIRALRIQQGTEKQHKRKVPEANLIDQENLQRVLECSKRKKDMLDLSKEIDRGKNFSGIEQTKYVALTRFHAGILSVFESLTGFSKASVNMYSELIVYLKNASDREEESC